MLESVTDVGPVPRVVAASASPGVRSIAEDCRRRAERLAAAGRLDAALAVAELGREQATRSRGEERATGLRSLLAVVLARTGRTADAAALVAGLRPHPDGPAPDDVLAAVLVWARIAGRRDEAWEAARELAGRSGGPSTSVQRDPQIGPVVAAVLLDRGAREPVAPVVAGLAAARDALGASARLRVRGLLDDAPGTVDEAVGLLRRSGSPLALAGALEDRARVAPADGRARSARREALEIYESCGAAGEAYRMRQEAGARRARGAASLTPAQDRVAHLVSEGMTNRQIADRLALSPHTVDTQLRQIFVKCGVTSRVHLAARIAGGWVAA